MDAAKLFEGIALLIDLAQRGEIDPWDVQVIDVIDRYLSHLVPLESATQAAYEADLSQSGQAFLSASMLVLFKANTLIATEPETAGEPLADELPIQDGVTGRRLPLEQQLCRRPTALPPQKRRVTLQELIDQLKLMATTLQLQSEADTATKKRHFRSPRTQALRALELAHQENLTEVAGELEQVLNSYSHSILKQEDWLDLDQLVSFWQTTKSGSLLPSNSHKVDGMLQASTLLPLEASTSQKIGEASPQPPPAPDRVSVFWALLLLSAQSKVELHQEEFYQEIKIRTLETTEARSLPKAE